MDSQLKLTDVIKKLKLLAVTKNRSISEIQNLYDSQGVKRMGENRLKEALEKISQLPEDIEWHFIGKLQSRKIRSIVEHFDVIQSVENFEQATKISECGLSVQIMVQVNISRREGRSGVMPEQADALIAKLKQLPHIELIGVMGMASPLSEVSEEVVLNEFNVLKDLQGELPECSMGMSGDWPLAVEAGSTMLRLGRSLFES